MPRKRGEPFGEPHAILPRDAKFSGTLVFEGACQIDGEFEGEIITEDLLVVGAGAEVKAQMSVGSVIIQGSVEGSIDAKSSVCIKPSGRIKGSVTTPHLIVEDTKSCGGTCQVSSRTTSASADASPPDTRSR